MINTYMYIYIYISIDTCSFESKHLSNITIQQIDSIEGEARSLVKEVCHFASQGELAEMAEMLKTMAGWEGKTC